MCETLREEKVISIEDSNLIERDNDAACPTVTSIEAEGIIDTLPVISETSTTAQSPLETDARDGTDLQSIHTDWRGDYTYTDVAGNAMTMNMGVFDTTDRISIRLESVDLGIELILFATISRISFDSTLPSARTAVLDILAPLYSSNVNAVTLDSGQIRWLEGNRVEVDLTITDSSGTTTYTDITKVL